MSIWGWIAAAILFLGTCALPGAATGRESAQAPGNPVPRPAARAVGLSAYEGWRLALPEMRTRVVIATVKLRVTDLRVEDGYLKGLYDLEVPLRASENEKGVVLFDIDRPIGKLRSEGGYLEGLGMPESSPGLRQIRARIMPHDNNENRGRVSLVVVGENHTVQFHSHYTFRPPQVPAADM